jgi:hypothetical protein
MDQGNLGIPVKNPHKPRFIRVICRHTRGNPGWQTHEFPNRLMIRYSDLGRRADLSAEHPVQPAEPRDARYAYPGRLWEPETYQYRCPQCGYDLQLRAANMMRLISALDALERQRTGNQAARIQRLDISAAELVLASLRQAGEAP